MLFGLEDASGFDFGSEKNLLIQEAEEAFDVNDQASCAEAITKLYDLLDDTLVSPRRGRRPHLRRAGD